MIKSCVTISLVPSLSGGPWVYWDDPEISIPKARAAGFDAVELFAASADSVDADKLAGLLDDNDIKLAIIGSMQGRLEEGVSHEQALNWLAEGLNELGQKAAYREVNIIFEPLNRYETDMINTISNGVNLIKSLDGDNVRLLADLFHMNIEEESIGASIRVGGDYIGHVHFVDSNRRPAGMGHIDLAEAAQALKEIGFEGYASAEALSYPDPDSAAAQTMRAFRQFFV
jgi:sugar phosphate isomerase/epimerase